MSDTGDTVVLPSWVIRLSGWSSLFATLVIFASVFMHLRNYRKPFQQRLMIRTQLILPIFALSCYSTLIHPNWNITKFLIEPLRGIYEAFVIYTFFNLLIDMLGGAKSIVVMTSGRTPVRHPGFMGYIFPDLDISDPKTFLGIKRGILQYVWLKPLLCFGILFAELWGWYDVNDAGPTSVYLWLNIIYNFSVSLSLYCLAIFWKILWNDLKPFDPIGKFLCVKLIIFASYWQGVILAILNFAGVLPCHGAEGDTNIGISIQNALLCVELVGFAIGHWFAFSYKPFNIENSPTGRLLFYYAFKDMIGVKDLVIDFRLTFYGDYYKDYKQFDSVEATIAHPSSNGRMGRINQGLRYHTNGKQKHWLPQQSPLPNNIRESIPSTSEANIFGFANRQRSGSHDNSSLCLSNASSFGGSTTNLISGVTQSSPFTLNDTSLLGAPKTRSDIEHESLEEIIKALNPSIDYSDEGFDDDESYYRLAASVVNNYKLDQIEVKKLINYPVADELVGSHEFGFKVKKLREGRLKQRRQLLSEGTSRTYSSV